MERKKPWLIYVITYKPTGKKYVGKTTIPLRHRLDCHLSKLQRGVHPSKEFQEDYNRFGGDICDFDIELYDTQDKSKKAEKLNKEQHLMIALRTYDALYGYNAQDPSMRWIRKIMGLNESEQILPQSQWTCVGHYSPESHKGEQVDFSKLKRRIKSQYGTFVAFAKDAGISKHNLSQKLNNKTKFSSEQIETACNLLGIGENEIGAYFYKPVGGI